jgi:hypothetical protein
MFAGVSASAINLNAAQLTCSLPASEDVTAVTNFLFRIPSFWTHRRGCRAWPSVWQAFGCDYEGAQIRGSEKPLMGRAVSGGREEASAYRDLTSRPKSFYLRSDPDQI